MNWIFGLSGSSLSEIDLVGFYCNPVYANDLLSTLYSPFFVGFGDCRSKDWVILCEISLV